MSIMELNAWTQHLRALYDKAISLYQGGNRDLDSYFTTKEKKFLASIGLKPINVYDFAEDWTGYQEPNWDTFLLIVAVRRDYFLYEQKGAADPDELTADKLPPKNAALDGIEWLPRIIAKARCFLEGGLCHDIMYCCGGDRRFLTTHAIHPADFLRMIWAAHGDEQKILAYVKKTKES